jgi:HAMP domain-containing protein
MTDNRIILQPEKYREWKRYRMGASVGEMDDWQEAVYTEPSRNASRESDLVVPFGQAAVTGFLTALLVLLGAAFLSFYLEIGKGFWWWLSVGGLVFALVTWWKWRGLLEDTRSLLRKAETIVNMDLDRDGVIGETVRLETVEKDQEGVRRGEIETLPISRERFEKFARGVSGGRGLAVSTWTGSAGLFSRSEYDALMDYLQRAGIVRWKNENAPHQGRELTRAGRAAIESV